MNPKQLHAPLTLWLFVLLAALPASAQDGLPINVGRDKTAKDSLFAYKQVVNVDGTVARNLTAVASEIHVRGRILGSISALGGTITLHDGAEVQGDILCLAGRIERQSGAQVVGRTTLLFSPHQEAAPPFFDSLWAKVSFSFGLSLVLFLLVALCFYCFPNQVNEAAFQLSQDLIRALIFGVLTWFALLVLYILSFALMVVAIGYPLFLLNLTATVLIGAFSLTVVFYQLGQWVEQATKGRITLGVGIVASVLAASALSYVPVLGPLAFVLVALFGAGIVIETRFGTNKQWFTRKARYWAA